MRISIIRKSHFNAAHRLYRPDWSDEQNIRVFGKCANPHYHGHNYELDVRLTGETDPETGMLIDLNQLKNIIALEVEEYFDHRNINIEIPEFTTPDEQGRLLNPTAENIAYVIYTRLRNCLDHCYELQVRLYETPRNIVEYPA